MAAIMRRRSGRSLAIARRSASGMVGSCQGASSSPPAIGSAKAGSAAAGSGGGIACSARKAAKKPFSQSRCSGEKGAESGI
jgi:hypothetical protein